MEAINKRNSVFVLCWGTPDSDMFPAKLLEVVGVNITGVDFEERHTNSGADNGETNHTSKHHRIYNVGLLMANSPCQWSPQTFLIATV